VGAKYGTPIDIWAVGCIMAELSDAQPLFPGSDDIDQLSQIIIAFGELPDCLKAAIYSNSTLSSVSFPALPGKLNFNKYRQKLTEKGIDLMKNMLSVDPSKRITASEALKHPYFDIIRPKVPRFQMTSTMWRIRSNIKMNSIESCTDRSQKSVEAVQIAESKSADKQSVIKERATNVFFKFGHKDLQNESKTDAKFESASLRAQLEKGINKIYYKKEKEKAKCVLPHNFGYSEESRSLKQSSILNIKTIPNFKVTQKKKEKSMYLTNA
jgi:serine/threonine protein kinase